MKKFLAVISAFLLSIAILPVRFCRAETLNSLPCKAAYLIDYDSGTVLFEKNATTRLPIASMCKIMTLLLCFESIDAGEHTLNEQVTVSQTAAGMGGSQVYLEANGSYEISNLLKSIIVCSANDSCVAMAETIAGSENAFVERMNERAKELGANDTLFANCTGLPKEPQYSCAKDVSVMLQALLHHPQYFEYSKIRNEEFRHPKDRVTQMTNTNRLLRSYEGCDSGKTGFTNQAGFCLAASAKRGNMRIISVTIGSSDSTSRFDCHKNMLNYAFANFTNKVIVDADVPLNERAEVRGGKQDYVKAKAKRNILLFSKKGTQDNITEEVVFNGIKAPVRNGDVIGKIVVYKNNVEADSVELLACEDIAKATVWDNYKEAADNWSW